MKNKTPLWRRLLDLIKDQPATPPPPARPTTELYVYITRNGKKFHYDPCCPFILEAFNRGDAIQMGISKARAAGRTACNKCCYSYLHE